MCTAIGCDSLLTIELSDVDIQPEQTYEIELCIDDGCRTETITIDVRHAGTGEIDRGESAQGPGSVEGWMTVWADGDYIDYYLPERAYERSAQVSFTLTDASGEVLSEVESTEVPLERSQPNGPDCLPICFQGRLII